MKRESLVIRPFEWDDLPAMVEVANRSIACNQEDQYVTLKSLQENFNRPYFYPLANCFVALVDGRIVGYTTAELDPRNGQGWGTGYVDPEVRRQGIGTALLRRADERHRERATQELPAGMPVVCTRQARDVNTATVTLLETEGYQLTRVTWFMHRNLESPMEPPTLPNGITLRPFNLERDAYAVYEAINEFFKENWGFVALPYDVWCHYNRPYMDTSLWLVAMDGDQIAGVCHCRPWGEGEPGLGWIDSLGVRSNWRKRSLGSALLHYGFHWLQEQGYTAVGLDVDSENKTNAVSLYERAGMHVTSRYLIYRKTLVAES